MLLKCIMFSPDFEEFATQLFSSASRLSWIRNIAAAAASLRGLGKNSGTVGLSVVAGGGWSHDNSKGLRC